MKDPSTISACIVDIDATITANRDIPQLGSQHLLNNALFDVLAQLLQRRGVSDEEAANQLAAYTEQNIYWDYVDILQAFGLPDEEGWAQLSRWHEDRLIVFPDAVRMIHHLHAAGLPLFIVSNNPLSGCLLKLQRANLATRHGSKYFQEIFGTNVCMGGKWSPEFWEKCLNRIAFPPDQLAIVGDNPEEDCALPRRFGVETVFLVDRKRTKRMEVTPKAYLVNTLDCVAELLLPHSACDESPKEKLLPQTV